jgi:3-oxoacyl-[acyl-carrier protein] reductase
MSSEQGPVVLITGGARGIGAACAQWFGTHGYRVAITYRGENAPATPEGVVKENFFPVRCDVTDPAGVEEAFSAIEEHFSPVEVLVANAGITDDTLLVRMSDEAWHRVLETNLTGAFLPVRRAVTKMLRLRHGRIILISSVSAFVGLPGQANYGASKAGLVGLARAVAREVASRSITVNVVAPGLVETDMTAALSEDRLGAMTAQVPLGRAGTPAEIAATVGFLASETAGYITGAVLSVDGGLGMGH